MTETNRTERIWAAVAHASVLLTVILGLSTGGLGAVLGLALPAAIWYGSRGKSEFVSEHARQATLYQLAGLVALVALVVLGSVLLVLGWIVAGVLTLVLVGLVLIPIMLLGTIVWAVAAVGLPIAQVAYGCYAAVQAGEGRPFYYRWVSELVERYRSYGS
jgi:uncharacterized Tic20 family protein